jgi:hypothetical protein
LAVAGLLIVGLRVDGAEEVPGIVIDHSPASSGLYIGSPGIAILPGGAYVAAHDWFGPKSGEFERATTVIFRSADRGVTWKKISEVKGAFWSSLFVHGQGLYLLGPDRHHGNICIRRSLNGGETWTSPSDGGSGLLRDNGQYHCAPVPVLELNGRLWRAFEWRNPPLGWGSNYCAGMLSAPADSDLLDARNWTSSNFLPSERAWNGGDMGGWLEGNAVGTRDSKVLDVLRVQTQGYPERAAIVAISADGKSATFDPDKGFIAFPGGAKKFAIRYDPRSDRYWALASIVPEPHENQGPPAAVRNTLALTCSQDLRTWTVRCVLLFAPGTAGHGFQYPDWQFDGEDLIAVVRTAFDDDQGGPHNYHDANFLTFHRWLNFRSLTMGNPEASPTPTPAQK